MTEREIIQQIGTKNYEKMHNLNNAYVALQSYIVSHSSIPPELVNLIQDYIDASIEQSNFSNEIINKLYEEFK